MGSTKKLKITFLHPDLGIGGAERLVVDAALALKKSNYEVDFVTSHHDPNHCFTETNDGTFNVTVVGDWIPRQILGRFFALCAYIRMIYAAFYIIFLKEDDRPDIVFCDLISVCIPVLKLRIPTVIFYCHYPDQLLTSYNSKIKSLYRAPLNFLEEVSTAKADKIFVNSKFTKSIFKKTFLRLDAEQVEVLYPSINTDFFDKVRIQSLERIFDDKAPPAHSCLILSINRYERKKKLDSAIQAIADLEKHLTSEEYKKVFLIIAGGYDKRVEENVEYHLELCQLADELGVADKILFLRSPSDIVKISILSHCDILIYTPPNEHFGIVPLEAMYASKPVVAHNSGGPLETIKNGVTGYLTDFSNFADKLSILIKSDSLRSQFGQKGRETFLAKFSFNAFQKQLQDAIQNLFLANIVAALNQNINNTNKQIKESLLSNIKQ